MSNYTLEIIKKEVLKWYEGYRTKGADFMQVTKNEEEILIIDLTFAHCLAQITINEPTFAPYKYVYFEAGTIESKKAQERGQPEMIHFFYDKEGMTVKEVLDELDAALDYCTTYIPNTI